MIKFVEFLLGQ